MTLRVVAQEVIHEHNSRRRILPHDLNASKFPRTFTMEHVKDGVLEFVRDFLAEDNLSAEVKNIIVRGFNESDTTFMGCATAEVGLCFAATSGQTADASVYVPIYKGEVYRPSMMSLEGKKMVFSPALIMQLMKSKESTTVSAKNMYMKNPKFTHEQNIDNAQGNGPFSCKPSTMVDPYYDPIYTWIPDSSRR